MKFFRLKLFALCLLMQVAPVQAELPLDDARRLYSEAMLQISRGRISAAEKLAPQLQSYVLYPYLELELVKAQLDRLSSNSIDAYLEQYGNSIVGQRIRIAWVNKLMGDRDWQAFQHYYRGHGGEEMRCVQIRALRETGQQQEALEMAGKLWKTGRSLPDICDATLQFWDDSLSQQERENQYWLRAELAVEAEQYGLAQYLLRRVSAKPVYLEILNQPSRLYNRVESLPINEQSRIIAAHNLLRLAAIDPNRSNELWHQLNRHLQFNRAQNYVIRDAIARQLIAGDAGDASYARDWLQANDPEFEDPYLTEWRVRLALRDGDWTDVQRLIAGLPAELQNSADWQYWWARADIELQGELSDNSRAMLQALASERGYYSFMAADLLGQPYQLASKDSVNPDLLQGVEQVAAVQRSRELHWHEQTYTAALEWRNAMANLSPAQQVAAAQLALDWGWHHQAIVTAIRAGAWDDLTLRFPTPYSEEFQRAADSHKLDLKWIYALARQESAFAEDARSPVGARGVMQIMPGTARVLARQMGLPLNIQDLSVAEKNIAMGSFYLARLMERFGDNRILATAAYNAGPSRVERVLLRQSENYPADIWIENLPYSETRDYIKNVLAFSIIYGDKLKQARPILTKTERLIGPSNITTARNE